MKSFLEWHFQVIQSMQKVLQDRNRNSDSSFQCQNKPSQNISCNFVKAHPCRAICWICGAHLLSVHAASVCSVGALKWLVSCRNTTLHVTLQHDQAAKEMDQTDNTEGVEKAKPTARRVLKVSIFLHPWLVSAPQMVKCCMVKFNVSLIHHGNALTRVCAD